MSGFMLGVMFGKLSREIVISHEKSGGIAEQSLTLLRTVLFINGKEKEIENYNKSLEGKSFKIQKYGFYAGISFGMLYLFNYFSYAIATYYGGILIHAKNSGYSGELVLVVFFCFLAGIPNIRGIGPILKSFADAKRALGRIIPLINRKSKINIEDKEGIIKDFIEGNITFENVNFCYPSRKNRLVLDNINLEICKGKKNAFVGESGCGKTTISYLIERFYDIEEGEGKILIDGNDIKDYNIKWLRHNIGYVGQEPVLFATSILENILFGKENSTKEEAIEAAKKANAYQFIMNREKGFDTYVGVNGSQLSGNF